MLSALDLFHFFYAEHWFISNPVYGLCIRFNHTAQQRLRNPFFFQKSLKLYSSPCEFESPILPKADSIADVKSSDSLSVKQSCDQ